MRVTFAGVGEAFDELLPNTSLLVETGSSSVLLDCGFSAPSAFWRVAEKPLDLDVIYISHFHGDHYFGIPALLVRMVEEGRKKRLTIAGPPGIEPNIVHLVEMAYSNAMSRAQFEIFYIECDPGEDFKHAGFRFRFAMGDHPMPCQGIRLDADGKSMFYSGDGKPTMGTRELAADCDLVVLESYYLDQDAVGHGSVDSTLEFAREARAGSCALVHVSRAVRHGRKIDIQARLDDAADLNAFMPEPGDSVEI